MLSHPPVARNEEFVSTATHSIDRSCPRPMCMQSTDLETKSSFHSITVWSWETLKETKQLINQYTKLWLFEINYLAKVVSWLLVSTQVTSFTGPQCPGIVNS